MRSNVDISTWLLDQTVNFNFLKDNYDDLVNGDSSVESIELAVDTIQNVLQIIFGIIGSMQANNGEYYRYPICIRMIT